jgi:hypothetical protein
MRRALALLALALAVVAAGFVLPSRMIGTNVDGYSGKERLIARVALDLAEHTTRPDIEAPYYYLVTARRVQRVAECPGPPPPPVRLDGCETPAAVEGDPECAMLRRLWAAGDFSAEVRTYTVSGLPLGEASVSCTARR